MKRLGLLAGGRRRGAGASPARFAAIPAPAAKDVTVSLCDGESHDDRARASSPARSCRPPSARKVRGRHDAGLAQNRGRGALGVLDRGSGHGRPRRRRPRPRPRPRPSRASPRSSPRATSMLWKREEKKWIDEGYKAFHNAKALGGTIGVSCDMCHPDASNTHPETYPKYQAQTQEGGAAPRHDQLVHREPAQGQAASPRTTRRCARSRPTSSPTRKGVRPRSPASTELPFSHSPVGLPGVPSRSPGRAGLTSGPVVLRSS